MAETGLSGFQCQGLVGPKMAIVGVPIAADTCIRPESLVTEISAAARARTALRKSVLVRSRTRLPAIAAISCAIDVSLGPPKTQTEAPSWTSILASWP